MIDINSLDQRLREYLNANATELNTRAIFNSNSIEYFTVQNDVLTEQAINYLDSTITIQEAECGWNPTGSDKFSNRVLTPHFLSVQKEVCAKDMLKTAFAHETKMGALAEQDRMPFEEHILNSNLDQIAIANEKMLWQGDMNSEDVNLNKMDGIYTIAKADTSVVKQTKTNNSIFERVQQIFVDMPATIAGTAVVFMSLSNYRKLIVELVNKNLYHYEQGFDNAYTMIFPGSNLKIVGVSGLEGIDALIATRPENLVVGIAGSESEIDLWFDKSDRVWKFESNYQLTTNYIFSDEIMINE